MHIVVEFTERFRKTERFRQMEPFREFYDKVQLLYIYIITALKQLPLLRNSIEALQ